MKKLLLLCLPCVACAAPFTAFRNGEVFTYRVAFGIFGHAGDLTIAAQDQKVDGKDVMSVTTDTKSRGIVRGLYAFDNKAEVVIEKASGRMQSVKESGADPKRATDSEISFDYAKRTAQYTDRVRTERSAEIPIPDGDPMDLISALVQTRDWKMKPATSATCSCSSARTFIRSPSRPRLRGGLHAARHLPDPGAGAPDGEESQGPVQERRPDQSQDFPG